MAVSLHESLVYPILSRLPPQSFQVNLKQWEPSAPPPGRNYWTAQDKVQFLIRGEPNEFLLPDRSYLACSLRYQQNVDGSGIQGAGDLQGDNQTYSTYLGKNSPVLTAVNHGPCWIGQVKESINGGGLEIYNHSDPAETPFYLAMRGLNSARNVSLDNQQKNVYLEDNGIVGTGGAFVALGGIDFNSHDCPDIDNLDFQNMEACGFGARKERVNGCLDVFKFRVGGSVAYRTQNGGIGQNYAIPLSYVSRIAQSASAVPLGLIGSYAAPSWRIEMTLSNTADVLNVGEQWGGFDPAGGAPIPSNNYAIQDARYEIRDLRMYGVTVKIFDEGVMQSLLALYSKVEVESVEGVPMPVSMTMATLNQETNSYPLPSGSKQIKILIPSTKHSVRGLFMMAVPEDSIGTTTGDPYSSTKSAIPGRYITTDNFHINYLQAKASGYCLQEAPQVEDQTNADGNLLVSTANDAWFAQQQSQAQHLFSAWSYHSERAVQNGQTGSSFALWAGRNRFVGGKVGAGSKVVGISFENLPHADLYQGRTQSSGIDLSNVGRLELTLRYGSVTSGGVNGNFNTISSGDSGITIDDAQIFSDLAVDYRLFTVLIYDQILEISRSGVRDISDTVLAPPAIV